MDVREKLVELLDDIQVRGEDFTDYEIYGMRVPDTVSNEDVASHLIAHGVTVQEWISVKERLPRPFVSVLVQMPGEQPFPTVREAFVSNDGIWQSAMFRREPGEVTHWQPMPQPPKGE